MDGRMFDGLATLAYVGLIACAFLSVAIPVGLVALAWWAWQHVSIAVH